MLSSFDVVRCDSSLFDICCLLRTKARIEAPDVTDFRLLVMFDLMFSCDWSELTLAINLALKKNGSLSFRG